MNIVTTPSRTESDDDTIIDAAGNLMRVLVTGAYGTLGRAAAGTFRRRGWDTCLVGHGDVDIRDDASLSRAVSDSRPDAVVHLAALTDLNQCMLEQELAWDVNVGGTENVVRECARLDIPLILASSYYLYARDTDEMNSEEAEIQPGALDNYYIRTKYEAESRVRAHSRHWIARLGSLYGGGEQDRKIVGFICRGLRQHEPMRLVNDQYIQPTSSAWAAEVFSDLIESRAPFGTYNVVASGRCSYFELGRWIAHCLAGDHSLITPVSAAGMAVTQAHRYVCADNSRLLGLGSVREEEWRSAIQRYVDTIANEAIARRSA